MDKAFFNDIDNDSKMFDTHKKVRDAYDLAYYLDFMFDEVYHSISVINDNQVYGIIDGVEFSVEIYGGTFLMLKVETGADDVERYIKRALKPVMWGMRSKDIMGLDETATYIVGTELEGATSVSVWDFESPEITVNEILDDIAKGKIFAYNVESKYLNKNSEELIKRIYYGTYIDFLPKNRVNEIENYSEFEMFFSIKSLQDEMKKELAPASSEEAFYKNEAERRLCEYFFHYLVQCTRRFGVNVNPPAIQPPALSVEFECWMTWWGEAFKTLIEQKPNILEDWKTLPNGYDANFYPKTPFKQYLSQYKQKLKEKSESSRSEMMRRQKEAKLRDEQRRKTLKGRFDTLLETIKTEAEDIASDKNNTSPFGDFDF